MNIDKLQMPCFNTTLMGVLKGVADYFDIKMSVSMLYGGSGHAFLMNIHQTLCPSGPYCWNYETFYGLVRNLGVEMKDRGFFSAQSTAAERQAIETFLREQLDQGVPCSLLNMENQLITGYDATGLFTAQPWPQMTFPPGHLTYGTWAELGDEFHVTFFTFRKTVPASDLQIIGDSLNEAIDLYHHPERHTCPPYAVGAEAYSQWAEAVRNGHGNSHGNWWNATVWAECRMRAAEYFNEIAMRHTEVATAACELSATYGMIADALRFAGDQRMDKSTKVILLNHTATLEASANRHISELQAHLGTPELVTVH